VGAQVTKRLLDVVRTIMAPKMPQNPKDIMGEFVAMQDLAHLARGFPGVRIGLT